VVGQLQEIDFQRVDYGGKIKQYAIVEEIGETAFRYPCPDCTCTLTMTDSEGFVIKNAETCTDEKDGLFTNILFEDNLHVAQTYQLRHFCISPVYGNGTVISGLQLSTQETSIDFTASSEVIAQTITDITIEGCQRTDNPSSLWPDLQYYNCMLWQSINGLVTPLYRIADSFTKTYSNEISGFWQGFSIATLPLETIKRIIIGMSFDPVETINGIVWDFITMGFGVISSFGIFVLVYEMYVIFVVIGNPSGIGMIAQFIEVNLKTFSWVFDKLMNVLSFLSNLVPFT